MKQNFMLTFKYVKYLEWVEFRSSYLWYIVRKCFRQEGYNFSTAAFMERSSMSSPSSTDSHSVVPIQGRYSFKCNIMWTCSTHRLYERRYACPPSESETSIKWHWTWSHENPIQTYWFITKSPRVFYTTPRWL